MPQFTGVDHVALSVTDVVASHRFYTEVLGFVQVMDIGHGRIYLHNPAGFTLALLQQPRGKGEKFTELSTGLDHLGLSASDLDELQQWQNRFDDLGVTYTPIREAESGYHLNFRDPDGIALEFFAPKPWFAEAVAIIRTGALTDEQIQQQAGELLAINAQG